MLIQDQSLRRLCSHKVLRSLKYLFVSESITAKSLHKVFIGPVWSNIEGKKHEKGEKVKISYVVALSRPVLFIRTGYSNVKLHATVGGAEMWHYQDTSAHMGPCRAITPGGIKTCMQPFLEEKILHMFLFKRTLPHHFVPSKTVFCL